LRERFTLDEAVRHQPALKRLRADYIRAGQEPPSTAELLAQLAAGEQEPGPPSPPRVNAGAGAQQGPAHRATLDENLRHLAKHGYPR
jgi:hypothetical protein